ncbi:MAG TPA: hypothetical protein VIH52_04125 [Candidatus Nanoarchaeia archaeon]
MEPSPKKKTIFIFLLVLLGVLLATIVLWLIFFRNNNQEASQKSEKVSTSSARVATNSAIVVDDETLIKQALVAKTGIAESMIAVTVSQKNGNFAKGFVGTQGEEVGGGYFLAVKVDGAWLVAYDGQANPNCEEVNPYNFPANMVPECLDSNGNLVTR